MRGLMMDRPLLIQSLIRHAARYHAEAEIVSRTTEGPLHRYTYADAERRSKQLAKALMRLGVGLGDRVATIAWNTASSLCYTSGTTGNPKGALYSHRSTLLHTYALCASNNVGIAMHDVLCPIVPMFHVNAWGVPYAAAMAGAKLVFPGPRLDG